MRFGIGGGNRRDGKNEATSGDVYENTHNDDRMSSDKTGVYTKMHQLHDNRQQSVGLIGRTCASYAIIRDEVAPLGPTLSGWQGSRGGTGAPPVTVMARTCPDVMDRDGHATRIGAC